MKGNSRNLSRGLVMGAVIASMIAIITPISTSVLCIAPGSHIAIEDLNSGCCAHREILAAAERPQAKEFEAAGDCGNCVDFLLTGHGPGTVSEVSRKGAASIAGECIGRYLPPAIVCPSEFGLGANNSICARIPLASSAPLRC
jgi:hypothetical protein